MSSEWATPSPPVPGEAVLVASGLCRHYATRAETIRAVDGVSVELRGGEVAVLAGRSGSGKSTLLNLLLGWDRPDAGSVEVRLPDRRGWSRAAVVPQGLGLLDELTVRQNVGVATRLAREDGFDVDELIRRLELDGVEERRPTQLSLGEQQRVAVARAVVCRPALLVADEPTAHQDERRARLVLELFRDLAEGGSAVLVASHDALVFDHADRRLDLDDGRLVG